MSVTNSNAMDTNPGAPFRATGPKWPAGMYDHLSLPSGAKVGATDNERLRQELARVGGIEGVHTEGRNIILARYAALLQRIHDAAGEKAVAVFLQSKKG